MANDHDAASLYREREQVLAEWAAASRAWIVPDSTDPRAVAAGWVAYAAWLGEAGTSWLRTELRTTPGAGTADLDAIETFAAGLTAPQRLAPVLFTTTEHAMLLDGVARLDAIDAAWYEAGPPNTLADLTYRRVVPPPAEPLTGQRYVRVMFPSSRTTPLDWWYHFHTDGVPESYSYRFTRDELALAALVLLTAPGAACPDPGFVWLLRLDATVARWLAGCAPFGSVATVAVVDDADPDGLVELAASLYRPTGIFCGAEVVAAARALLR